MSNYKPSVEERREAAKAIENALNQCGISVRYAIAGPSEFFDAASVLLKSEFFASHDQQIRGETKAGIAKTIREIRTLPLHVITADMYADIAESWQPEGGE